jgi:ammonium transporter, Amt family
MFYSRAEFEDIFNDLQDSLLSMWVITAVVNIILMQLGFSFLEVGSVSIKNTSNILIKNQFDTFVGAIGFYLIGFAFMNNANGGVIGDGSFFFCMNLTREEFRRWIFQFSFCTTSATIVSGSLAERVFCDTYIIFSFLMAAFIFPVASSWLWGHGWLYDLGFKDFAGAGMVHSLGGMGGLVGTMILGPRYGKF